MTDWMLAYADQRTAKRKAIGAARAHQKRIRSGDVDPLDDETPSSFEIAKIHLVRHMAERGESA